MSSMYAIELNIAGHLTEGMLWINNAVFTTKEKAHDMLLANGFVMVAQCGTVVYTKGDILAMIYEYPVNPVIGKEEVQLR